MSNTPSLSAIMVMSLVAVFAVGLSFQVYTSWIVSNEGTIDPQYSFIYDELTSSYDSLVSEAGVIGNENSAKSILSQIGDVATGAINIFVIGLSSIGQFFSLIPILTSILEMIRLVFPMIDAVIGLAIVIMVFYFAMRFIKSARGTTIDV